VAIIWKIISNNGLLVIMKMTNEKWKPKIWLKNNIIANNSNGNDETVAAKA
jgi:hypothetical protein